MENLNLKQNEVLLTFNKEEKKEFAKQRAYERLGETVMQNCGEVAFIVNYNGASGIVIQFQKTKELVNTTYQCFKNGNVKSHFTPSRYAVGIVGLETTTDSNGKVLPSYICWSDMLRRCYSESYKQDLPTYDGCYVCDEWLHYSNFKTWYNENHYECDGQRMELDKDILCKGNKEYSPDKCVFVPHSLNSMFTKRNADRGELPIGVRKMGKKYGASCNVGKRDDKKHLGTYLTPEKAFYDGYKPFKEQFIKDKANEYKEKIPTNLYEAMCNYTVSITD
jgi:hypothetical protein